MIDSSKMMKFLISILAILFSITTHCFASNVNVNGPTNNAVAVAVAFGYPTTTTTTTTKKKVSLLPLVTSVSILVSTTLLSPNEVLAAAVASEGFTYEKGQTLFTQNCASCHLNGQNIMNPKRDLQKDTLLRYFGGESSLEVDANAIIPWIEKSGQHKRLFFPNVPGGKLTSEDYKDVISYIVDQANNEKW